MIYSSLRENQASNRRRVRYTVNLVVAGNYPPKQILNSKLQMYFASCIAYSILFKVKRGSNSTTLANPRRETFSSLSLTFPPRPAQL